MERRCTKTYRLIDLRDSRVFDSNSAKAIVDTMFVFTMSDIALFKAGRRVTLRLAGEIGELARKLEGL